MKSLKAKIFLVEMDKKCMIKMCWRVLDKKRSSNGSFNNIYFHFRQDDDYKEKSFDICF